MPPRNRLTNNSDETDVALLLSGDTIFSIPYFQRAYKWKADRLKQLDNDILNLVDESGMHFLGAVIVHGRRSNPSDPDVYEVIDGQQRITTLFLYLCAVVKTLATLREYDEAVSLFLKYLVINRDTRSLSNFKIHSCKDDRAQLNSVYNDLMADTTFAGRLGGFRLKPLPSSGAPTGTLRNNYKAAVRFLKGELDQGGLDRIQSIYRRLLNNISVVQIDVSDPTNGPKIFDSLNSRQEPMTIGDLIRNEVFSKVAAEDQDTIERVDFTSWQPFYKRFDQNGKNYFDEYFFPYGLIQNANLQKSEVYSSLRKSWEETKDPHLIISELAEYQNAFIDLKCGLNLCDHTLPMARSVGRLCDMGLPSSTLPFLMQLSRAVSTGLVAEGPAVEIFAVIESFLVRRAVCGHEPTGLHAVFKRLWVDCGTEYTASRVTGEISKHRTVVWPNTAEFEKNIRTRPLYGVQVTPYIIYQYDVSLRGDAPALPRWTEHVLPVTPDPAWFSRFSREEHAMSKDLLANLLPLSAAMNQSLQNKPYADKRAAYISDSGFKSTRQFAEGIEDWTPLELETRARSLGAWAALRWPHEHAAVSGGD